MEDFTRKPEITKVETIAKGKFLDLQKIHFINEVGDAVQWEACQRVNGTNAVSIFAIKPEEQTVVLVRQFRAPVGKYCIECPAGLIEPGESVLDAARREMLEETGYTLESIAEEGFAVENSCGLTGELSTPIVAFIDESIPQKELNPDGQEYIEVVELPLTKLYNYLKHLNGLGDVISGKLLAFSYGMRMNV